MIDNLVPFIQFIGAVSFALLVVDNYNKGILNFFDLIPNKIRSEMDSLRDLFNSNKSLILSKDDLEEKSLENSVGIWNFDLKNLEKQSCFNASMLLSGLHCVIFLIISGFENELSMIFNIRSFIFIYSGLILLYLLSIFLVENDFASHAKENSVIVYFGIVCVISFPLSALVDLKFMNCMLFCKILIISIPLVVYGFYYYNTLKKIKLYRKIKREIVSKKLNYYKIIKNKNE
jgi:hypothetical protein